MITFCKSNYFIFFSGGTTNLRNHLKRHPTAATPVTLKKQTTMGDFTSTPPKPVSGPQAERITQAIADMLVSDYLPLSLVEADGFRRLMAIVAPSYTVPCRNTIRARIVKRHDTEKSTLAENLKNASSAAITTDTWTSNSTKSFLTVTSHHVSDEWQLHSNVLVTRDMPEKHTGENLAKRLKDTVDEFGLTGKIESCVHDNARNMENAGSRCDDWSDVSCFGHTLQLCIKPVMEILSVSNAMARCRKLVGHFKHSTTLTAELTNRQIQRGKKTPLSLVQDVPTRWNSSFDMASRLLELRSVVSEIMLDSDVTKKHDSSLLLKDTEWDIIRDICTVLKPFKDGTTYMCSDTSVSVSDVYPLVSGLLSNQLNSETDDSPLLSRMKDALATELKRRYMPDTEEAAQSLPMLASLLDPRWKKLSFLPRSLRKKTEEALEQRLDEVPLKVGSRESADVCQTPPTKRPRLSFMAFSPEPTEDDELKLYLAERSVDADPLEWWKKNEYRFPRVAYLAKCILAVPATSVPSERIFSSAGLVLSKLRNRLTSDIVDSIIFLNKNKPVPTTEL